MKYKTQEVIDTVDKWKVICPLKNPDVQWVDGASAKELAMEYVKNGSDSIESLLIHNGFPKAISLDIAYPEYETRFDSYGQGRVHDLLIKGTIDNEPIIVAVKGKVNESFGTNKLSDYYFRAKVSNLNGINSNKTKRVEELLEFLFADDIPKKIGDIKYQLLTTLIGTIKEAEKQNVKKVFLVFQVFNSQRTEVKAVKRNHKELN